MGQTRSSTCPQVILVGLDSAGKSTLLARLLTGQVVETSPTIGFNVGSWDLDKKTSLTVWDVGGQKSMRPNWRFYLDNCKALVFVVDSSEPGRMMEAHRSLKKVLSDDRLRGVPLMVLANKKDLPNSMTIREIALFSGRPPPYRRVPLPYRRVPLPTGESTSLQASPPPYRRVFIPE
ncbi:putative ADP-ribosylation factor-like protein 11 [Scophthalmus maximus]|uniref:Putative ADP-ribosylation factor-like protein 11 n=1 Tax=Scophthalmus maximus TaxID=52904 RepID=A0A2U9AUX8_SCOMX|nr:putative ADP-ribosylation factor-like protein 11 [Scophthalmus maximus]